MKSKKLFAKTNLAKTIVLFLLALSPLSNIYAENPKIKIDTSRVLFLGNSITQHGPAPKIKWVKNIGMAASSIEKDYVHQVAKGIKNKTGKKPAIKFHNIARFERNPEKFDLKEKLKADLKFKPTLVIIALGENVPKLNSKEAKLQFKKSYSKLLNMIKKNSKPTIIVRSSFWPDKNKDAIMKEACQEVNGIFVDIKTLAKDESNYARSEHKWEHAGVGKHPGDKGMKAIADAILKVIK